MDPTFLNTNIYYHDDFATGPDPCGQMAWLKGILDTTDESKTKLIITAHVPPGGFELKPGTIFFTSPAKFADELHNRYVDLFSSEQAALKVSAHLYGHLHTDTFRLLMNPANWEVRGVAFMVGSVTPSVWGKSGAVGTNPTIKLFTYDDDDLTILDYQVFHLDLSKANGERAERKKRESMDDSLIDPLSTLPPVSVQPKPVPVIAPRPENETQIKPLTVNNSDVFPAVPDNVETSTNKTDVINNSSTNVNEDTVPSSVNEANTSNNYYIDTNSTTKHLFSESKVDLNDGSINAEETPVQSPGNNSIENNSSMLNDEAFDNKLDNTLKEEVANVSDSNVTKDDSVTPVRALGIPDDSEETAQLVDQWKPLYKATESFQVDNLTADSMLTAFQSMYSDGYNGTIFQAYLDHNTGGHDIHTPEMEGECGLDCWWEHLCSISKLKSQDLEKCLKNKTKKCVWTFD